jgi:hypothetical protein
VALTRASYRVYAMLSDVKENLQQDWHFGAVKAQIRFSMLELPCKLY